ncbi:polyadenylation and cleavage factor-like [Heracleum sosnowskyi]|uniref:Polyadenylation and cleavage factor-like n=1 Tax=Heracleum sosnowskyi TaxID=360622 RepID=A0AAD8MU56_9APIA|nr:polyadenylation and cleavage factor-like [Heracleum sosnowskyi]
MEMENSRRSFDRSRDMGLKRPRLDEQIVSRNSNGRAFAQSQQPESRARGDLEGSGNDTSVQELASQYRTALAELTFNSKPIITNLTIIAGESLHAAKAIASIICSNILEVPTEQKLPSLYLLDSIVKNIGRDYIKYFASRLPEVFCKAYRQVDPAVHPGMRHLFGTWRNVFPPQSLQMIEKELGFPPAVSSSASGAAKPGSQSLRPAQSIHVNPKYLEARQNQQSSKVKQSITDINGSHGNSPAEMEKSLRTSSLNAARRADPRLKMLNMQNPPKDVGTGSFQQNSLEIGAYDYNTELARHSASGVKKTSDRISEQVLDRSWYGSGSNIPETTSSRISSSNVKLGNTNYLGCEPANRDPNLQNAHSLVSGRSSIEIDRSWKNSEEEEYTWDDVNSRSTSYGVNRKSKRDPRLMDDSERMDTQSAILKPQILHEIGSSVDKEASSAAFLSEQRNQIAFGTRAPSTGPRAALGLNYPGSGYSASLSGLSTNSNSMVRTSFPVPGSPGSVVQQRYSVEAASPSGQSPMHQHPSSPYLSKHQTGEEPSQAPPHADVELHRRFPQNLPMSAKTVTQNVHRGNTQNLQPPNSQGSPYINSSQQRHQNSFLQNDPMQYDPYAPSNKPVVHQVSMVENPLTIVKSSSGASSQLAQQMLGQLNASHLLTAVMDSGILGKSSGIGNMPKDSSQNAIALPSRPPLSSGVSPTQSEVKVASATNATPLSHESTLITSIQRQKERPPLPHGPPPSSTVSSALEQTATVANATSNPMSSLLNTLMAKGLISASKTESTAPPQVIVDPCNQIPGIVTTPMVGSSFPVSSAISASSTCEKIPESKPNTKSPVRLDASNVSDIKSHIGFEFKPDVIRVPHPSVIDELLHDLPHKCSICGLKVKLKESFDRHMEWHTLKNADSGSRRWYVNSLEWSQEKVSTDEVTDVKWASDKELENDSVLMVPADENHCVCVLCGELFEDYYNKKMDRWMFKEAVYLTLSAQSVITSFPGEKGPIVHANCISESSLHDLGLANDVKVERDA